MSAVVDMGIARLEDLRKVERPDLPIRSILAQPDYGFEWVAWVEGPGPTYGWTWFSDQIIEGSAMGERRVFEIVVDQAIAEMERAAR